MFSFDKNLSKFGLIAFVVLASALPFAGCNKSHNCGSVELCNFEDDDCDGQTDEGFVDSLGRYGTIGACGSCGVDCRGEFSGAAETACIENEGNFTCSLVQCLDGYHRAGSGACVPDAPVLCLTCQTDDDCALRQEGAKCLPSSNNSMRCATPCEEGLDCPAGFVCSSEGSASLCVPANGVCGCSNDSEGAEFGCFVSNSSGQQCAGVQTCSSSGLTVCRAALSEQCNDQDDDCDNNTDEGFRDADGVYVGRLACGGCGIPCVEPGPNMTAVCQRVAATAACSIECQAGFVDVDGIAANGCECQRFDMGGPPPGIGGDPDCDGVPNTTDDFIYMTASGNDTNPGTLEAPVRTFARAIAVAESEGKDVLVSRGVYEGPLDLRAGVSIFGGYSPDFRDRDLELYPVLLERTGAPGAPALRCSNIRTDTRGEGISVQGSDAVSDGEGSTAVFLDGCDDHVVFSHLVVFAGRARDGRAGIDSSANLAAFGYSSLADLDGLSGSDGQDGSSATCTVRNGGAGGQRQCFGGSVSGGRGGNAECPGSICQFGQACGNGGCTDFTSPSGVCDLNAARAVAVSNPAAETGSGTAGGAAGELTYNAPTNRGVCNFCDDNPTLAREGGEGSDGADGTSGFGGFGCTGSFTLDPEGRLRSGDGSMGTAGQNGSGGGGGTAGAGFEVVAGTQGTCDDRSGGSGGGGGSGGCGAPGATGGQGGGSSIGILVRAVGMSPPRFDAARVVTGSGGSGGDGGVGSAGGSPGAGAPGGVGRFFCARTGGRGGDGGRGGSGGGGGGGCGGGSHGYYVISDANADLIRSGLSTGAQIERTGVPGAQGRGGFSPASGGADGLPGDGANIFVRTP